MSNLRETPWRIAAKTLSFLILITLFLQSAVPATAGVIGDTLQQQIKINRPGRDIPVIITLADQPDLTTFASQPAELSRRNLVAVLKDKAARSQAPLIVLLKGLGAKEIKSLWLVNSLAVTLKPNLITALARRPEIASIRLDRTFTLSESTITALPAQLEWNIEAIRAAEVWSAGHRGAGIVIASLDSGVDLNHQEFADNWRGLDGLGNSWFDPHGEHPLAPYDADGHGTRVMGVMVGGDRGGTAIGVAPDATWIAAKLFDDAGESTYSAGHAAFQWLLDPDGRAETDDAPHIVNNSWGFRDTAGECIDEFARDIANLKLAGIAVVFSAGNDGPLPATSSSPANYPESFAVGASDMFTNVADFSSRGPSACDGGLYPDVVAPGVQILTADLTFGLFPDAYDTYSGTSFAAPHLAGAMALLLDAAPWLSVSALENALSRSAVSLGGSAEDNVFGHGQIDVRAALDLVESICESDFDNDTDVDFVDMTGLLADFGRTDCTAGLPCAADLDGDGDVDGTDIFIVRTDYGREDCPGFQL